jgi:elongation factor Ts
MNITAADVNKLRTMTGAGMMDCKKALTEAEGDFEKAVELLRKKGQKVAASRGDRDATEGVVLAKASADNTSGYIIVLNCETDFVAKNDGFVTFANSILDAAIANNANSPEAVKALTVPGTSLTIEEKIEKLEHKLRIAQRKKKTSRVDKIKSQIEAYRVSADFFAKKYLSLICF